MGGYGDTLPNIEQVLHEAAQEKERAARAAAVAVRHEQLADLGPAAMRGHHRRMATLFRRNQQRHLAASRLHTAYAEKLLAWLDQRIPRTARPPFIAAVAGALGATGVGITLLDVHNAEALRSASTPAARAALDLEYTLHEGPGQDAAAHRKHVTARGVEIPTRWPQYGPAVTALGIQAVEAAPLHDQTRYFGALTAFDAPPDPPVAVDDLADAIAQSVLPNTENSLGMPLLRETDVQAVINQAAGMLAAQRRCPVSDALALIRAHAFATDEPTEQVAAHIVDRTLRLD